MEKMTQEEKNELVLLHMSKLRTTVNHFVSKGECEAEITSEVYYGFAKALESYEEENEGSFYAFANSCIMNQLGHYFRKKSLIEKYFDKDISEPPEGSFEDDTYERLLEEETKEEVAYALLTLSKDERTVIESIYGLRGEAPMTQQAVGDILGYSQAGVCKIRDRGKRKIFKEMDTIRRDLEA